MKKDTVTQVVFLDEAMKVDISLFSMITILFPPPTRCSLLSAFIHTFSAFV
jgi:hypothetical protein